MLLQSFIILTGSVMLGGFVQEGASMTELCQPFPVVKTFNLRDPTTNEQCTLKILNYVCGGFCDTGTGFIGPKNFAIDPQLNAYRLLPETNCECCEPIRQPIPRTFPAMAFTCVEGQKWNQTLKLALASDRKCNCRTCTSSTTVN